MRTMALVRRLLPLALQRSASPALYWRQPLLSSCVNVQLVPNHRPAAVSDLRLWHSGKAREDDDVVDGDSSTSNTTTIAENQGNSTRDISLAAAEIVKDKLEHRAKEMGAFAVSKRVVEQIVSSGEKVGERSMERAAEKALERAGEKAIERAGEKVLERAGERTLERGGEKALERAGEKALEKAGERIGERFGEKTLQEASEKAAERGTKRALERALEQAGERTMERTGEKVVERAGERALQRAAEQASEKSIARAGYRSAERSGERLVERTGETAMERVGERSSERILSKASANLERFFGVPAERVAIRLGQGLTIALPVLGGLFAFYLFRSDYKRWKQEKQSIGDRNKVPSASLVLFYGAGAADFIDTFLHFWIAFGLFTHVGHDAMMLTEHMSMGCAVVSTLFAILGEILSHRRLRKRGIAQ